MGICFSSCISSTAAPPMQLQNTSPSLPVSIASPTHLPASPAALPMQIQDSPPPFSVSILSPTYHPTASYHAGRASFSLAPLMTTPSLRRSHSYNLAARASSSSSFQPQPEAEAEAEAETEPETESESERKKNIFPGTVLSVVVNGKCYVEVEVQRICLCSIRRAVKLPLKDGDSVEVSVRKPKRESMLKGRIESKRTR